MPPQQPQLDPQVVNLAKAIRQTESGGNFQAKGKSGEYGAYQFMPDTWASSSQKYLGQNIPIQQATPQQQNEVAYKQIKEWKDQGYNVGQIASLWNSGTPEWQNKVGTNKMGVAYNVPKYVDSVANAYQTIKKGGEVGVDQNNPSSVGNTYQPGQRGFFGQNKNDSLTGQLLDNSITRGITSFFPGKQVGEAIGTGIAKAIVPENQKQYITPGPTNAQLAGDIAQIGLTVAMPTVGSELGLAGRLGSQALIGAGFGATGAIKDGSTNLADITKQAGTGALIGGALGVGGELLGAGINKIAQPYAKELNTEAIKSAERLGVNQSELPLSYLTNNKTVRYAESIFNSQKIAEQADTIQSKLQAKFNDVIANTGISEDLATAGKQIAKGLTDFETAYKEETAKLYEAFSEKGGKLPVKSFNAIDTLNNILDNKQAIGESKDAQYFAEKLAVLTGGESKKAEYSLPTFDTLKKIRTAVGEKIGTKFLDPFVKQNIGELKQLYGSLTKDMEQTIAETGNKKLIDGLQKANQTYIKGRELLNTEYAKTIRRFSSTGQFDKIIPAITSSSKSISNIPALLTTIGEENIPRLQTAILNDIFDKAQGTSESFTEKGVAKMINKYGEDRLKLLLTPGQFSFIQDLDKVSRVLAQAEKISNGSQTAFIGKSLTNVFLGVSAIKDLMMGNIGGFLTNLSPILGEKGAEAFLNSQLGRKIVTTGFELNKNIVPGIRQATKVGTYTATK